MDRIESSGTIGARARQEFEDLLKHDRAVVLAVLVFVGVVSWLYLLAGAGMGMSAFEMSSLSMAVGASGGSSMSMPMTGAMEHAMTAMATPADWTWGYAFLMFGMWWVMMIAMMLPGAAPMILLFALVNRRSQEKGGPYVPTAVFAGAYLVAWSGFGVVAVVLLWGLERAELLSPMMASRNLAFGGALLVLAGGLPAFTAEARLPAPLTRADRFHRAPLAGRPPGRVSHGGASRALLPRLLLGADGASFLRRRHEPVLDCRIGAVRAAGEDRSAGTLAGVALRTRPRRMGRGPLPPPRRRVARNNSCPCRPVKGEVSTNKGQMPVLLSSERC